MKNKTRLDALMVERGLTESRTLAQRLIMAGQVTVNKVQVIKPSVMVAEESEIVVDHGPRFVSRGGEKLQGALDAFNLTDLSDLVCFDVGSSTGGFTDCMLQAGAARVYAIDVGTGLLHWKLRNDPRVICMEKTNARDVQMLPELTDFGSIDASFISLKILMPVVKNWLKPEIGQLIALIKPQFEAGRVEAAKGAGVIRDPKVHAGVLTDILRVVEETGMAVVNLIRSPLLGPKGNTEFLVLIQNRNAPRNDLKMLIRSVFAS
jgi:23S rRNA (cytidine1920-2'-O)/16S rRNA (cytidine1409-2'-O)-methyltransferase